MQKAVREALPATIRLITAAGIALCAYLFIAVLLCAAGAALLVVGAGMLPEAVLLLRRLAGAKRRSISAWTGCDTAEAYRPLTGTVRARVSSAIHDPGTYTDLRWLIAYFGYGLLLPFAAILLWPIGILVDTARCGLLNHEPTVLPLIGRLADLDARWSTLLLRPSPKALLAVRVAELTETRAGAVAAHGAELRRIERDLHDGVQAQLVTLAIRLGLAIRAYDHDDRGTARALLDQAQDQVEEALAELRHVVRGIHPPILTDRGLSGAVRALAASGGLDVTVDAAGMEAGPRAPAAIEAAAYFVVAEALTNAAKHSGSDRVTVRIARTPAALQISVRDDGRGGASETHTRSDLAATQGRSGLLGMRRRIAALDGTLLVTSPVGGPTVIEVELPCAW